MPVEWICLRILCLSILCLQTLLSLVIPEELTAVGPGSGSPDIAVTELDRTDSENFEADLLDLAVPGSFAIDSANWSLEVWSGFLCFGTASKIL